MKRHVRMRVPTCSKMSSFFIKNDSRRGKKRGKPDSRVSNRQPAKIKKKVKEQLNEEIASDSDEEISKSDPFQDLGIDEVLSDYDETPAEKRLRLAKQYIEDIENEEKECNDEVDYDAISHRLKEDVLERTGKLQKKVADQYVSPTDNGGVIKFFKGHQLSVTALCLTPDDKYAFTGSKDCFIIKWNVALGSKEIIIPGRRKGLLDGATGHTGHVLALVVSSDGQFLASGGTDKIIHLWNAVTCIHLHTFKGHKDAVSGLVFQNTTHELFSCSFDRTIKVWNVDELTYVETLFGHQDGVTSIDCLSKERPVTAGGNDRTLRVWKIIEESQLVFNGHKSSIDAVKMINNENFVSGSQDGSLALWNITKKKPLATARHHQNDSSLRSSEHWITTVTTMPNTDLIASGSNDGYVHFWKCGETCRSLDHLFSIPLAGFVNGLSFSKSGEFLVAGIGQEHKLGRWWKSRDCKNGLAIIPMIKPLKHP